MAQLKTNDALKTDKPAESKDKPKDWYTFEGPKIAFEATLGTSKNMKVLGFQASTKINHEQSISWGTASLDVKGPAVFELSIKGARKTLKMDLSSSLEIAPVALIYKAKDRLSARALDSEQDGAQDKEDLISSSALVVESESNGNKNENSLNTTANVTTTE
ncbi:MAG: hypothetical protein RIB84_07940 [Sneathiellaceae bacterium]